MDTHLHTHTQTHTRTHTDTQRHTHPQTNMGTHLHTHTPTHTHTHRCTHTPHSRMYVCMNCVYGKCVFLMRVCVCVSSARVACVKSRDLHWALVALRDQKDIDLGSLRILLGAHAPNPC